MVSLTYLPIYLCDRSNSSDSFDSCDSSDSSDTSESREREKILSHFFLSLNYDKTQKVIL